MTSAPLYPIRAPALALLSLAWLVACGGGSSYGGGDAGGGGMLPAASLTLSIEPSTIQLGQTATLTWSSDAGNNCSASGDWNGAQSASGTRSITPTATGTQNFTLTCSGSAYSGEATRSVTLTIGSVTLAQIQASIFTPRCTLCHDGSQPANGILPGAMNLNAGASFASLVNVASQEQPSVLRVAPGNADASYLVRKLEGSAGITGQRMPFGGPFLDAAAIAQVRAWIAAGAPNN